MEQFGFEITVCDSFCCHKYKIVNNALQYIPIRDFVDTIAREFGASVKDLGIVSKKELKMTESTTVNEELSHKKNKQ